MTGKQWAGIGVAVALAGGIYLLPQTVVQNKSESLPATSAPAPGPQASGAVAEAEEHFEGDGHDHGDGSHEDGHDHAAQRQDLPESVRQRLQTWKESASKTGDKEKFAIFADSLAANWAKYAWYDSAAHWAEKAVMARPTTERRLTAGGLWYDALQLSPDLVQQRSYSERAANHLKKVLEEEPSNTDAQIRLALTYVISDNPMQGILLLRQVLEREPSNTDALYHMGILSFQSSQYEKAIQRFEQLLGLKPDHKEGHFYMAMSFIQLGQNEKAREHLLAVQRLETNPEVKAVVEGYLSKLNQ